MRAVLDVNVLISAALSPRGTPARLLQAWVQGTFELIVSPKLLAELERALAYPKIRKRIGPDQARDHVSWLAAFATLADDPREAPSHPSPDPGDDYLLALAASVDAYLVSGDGHVLSLRRRLPIVSPRRFLDLLESP